MTTAAAKEYLAEVHAFRGFAIATVIGAHSWSAFTHFFGGDSPSSGMRALSIGAETAFRDSTVYFALISGLLFSRVLHARGWSAFARSKLLNVVAPYTVLTLFFSWLGHDASYRLSLHQGAFREYVSNVAVNLVTGGSFFHLWYIPVLCALYVLTPFAQWVLAERRLQPVVWVCVLAPLVVSRQFPELSWKNPVFFFGAYVVGMWIGRSFGTRIQWCRRHRLRFLLIAAGATSVVAWMQAIDLRPVAGIALTETVWYVQRLSVAALVLPFLGESPLVARALQPLASLAFPIYFLHAFIILVAVEALFAFGVTETSAPTAVLGGAGLWATSAVVSVLIARSAQRVLGSRSRLLLGA